MRALILILLALIASLPSHAKAFSIGFIETSACEINDDGSMTQSGWLISVPNGIDQCILPLLEGNGWNNKPRPRIIINNNEIDLIEPSSVKSLNKKRELRRFESKDGSIKISLTYWLAGDSCADPDAEGKCCGQYYEGELVVSRHGATKIMKVHQYHGM